MNDFRPSDFWNDPLGGAGNQAAHVLIGAATVAAIGHIAAVVAIWGGWEAWQWVNGDGGKKRRIRDGALDFGFFMLGGIYAGPAWWPIVALFAVGIYFATRG